MARARPGTRMRPRARPAPAGPRGPRRAEAAAVSSASPIDPLRILLAVTALRLSSRLPTELAGRLMTAYDVPPSAMKSAISEMTVGKLGRFGRGVMRAG